MSTPLGTQIFWMVSIGLVIGYVGFFVGPKRRIKLIPSIIIGTLGAVVTGLVAVFFNFDVPLAYAIVGAVAFLFVSHAFRSEDEAVTERSDAS